MIAIDDSEDAGDVFDSIQRGDIEQCAHFIQLDRSILKHKGWGGFTPLHYAALHGNRTIVDLLLSNGADPNLTCDAGQTAFHFACRQGNVYVMHQMIQYGADLRIIDLQGKTALHHAVSGGSIVAIHYLWETGMFRFSDGDQYQVTPLHLAASTGNIEVVRYLLRDQGCSYHVFQRCAVDAVDQQGATALHVAAERGAVEVCWTLLQRAGYRLLHVRDHCGLTPLDLSRQGKTFRHLQLTKLLSQHINEPIHHTFKESHFLYYWSLLFPSVSGAVIFLIASVLRGYGGVVCSLLFPWLAKSIFAQFHRMATYQRLPNPIYLGTLIAGLLHSLLCFYGKIMPSMWPSSGLMHVSVVHFSLVLLLFCKVLSQDPGTLGPGDADPRFSSIADLVESNENVQRFCIYCELFKPDHTKHCKLCDVCVRSYDHHCLFLNVCVGHGNHRLFILFIVSMVTAHLFFLAMATRYLYGAFALSEGEGLSSWLSVLGTEFWVTVMATLNALTLFWAAWLLTEQFDAIAMGSTTYYSRGEIPARQRSLGQRYVAVLTFLLEGRRRVGGGLMAEQDKPSIDI